MATTKIYFLDGTIATVQGMSNIEHEPEGCYIHKSNGFELIPWWRIKRITFED